MKSVFKKIIAALLKVESRAALKRFKPSIVAVTGSVGKTSTKDAVFTVFSGFVQARKSEKSFNSEIGVPLTILGLRNAWSNPMKWASNLLQGLQVIFTEKQYPKWLILEIGADRPGDIRSLAKWIKPKIVVLTRFPDVPVHVEYFSSPEKVVDEKMALAEALQKGGTIVANADDAVMMKSLQSRNLTALTYGFSESSIVRGRDYHVMYEEKNGATYPTGFGVTVSVADERIFLTSHGSLGLQHAYPLLATLAASKASGFDIRKTADILAGHVSPPGRMKILPGINESLIIDDSYNSSPVAAKEALNTLRDIKATGRKIVIFGDMLELGKYSVAEHETIGREALFADLFITVGLRARGAGEAALKRGKLAASIVSFPNSAAAAKYAKGIVSKGDIILVKGSQGTRMERISFALLAHPETAKDVLVRQEGEWERR